MPPSVTDNRHIELLRARAAARLAPPESTAPPLASQLGALAVLHKLASAPESAPDALAMLHELQVHQVELELQHEELRQTRADLEAALARQSSLVDHAPVATLSIDAVTGIHDANLATERLLGLSRSALRGLRLSSFLAPRSAVALFTLLARVQGGVAPHQCSLLLADRDNVTPGEARPVLAVANADPSGGNYLLALVETGRPEQGIPPA